MKKVGFAKKTMTDLPLDGEVVLLRADYNVPLDENGKIADDYRLQMSLPTLQKLIKRNCKIVICSHLGRPKGQLEPKYSLEPVAKRLVELLGSPVKFVSDCVGDKPYQASKNLKPGQVLLLENLRFYAEEEANDRDFARKLAKASRAKYFIQDGFGVVHRAHASTDAITEFLPSVAGLLLEREVETITKAMAHPQRPLTAILGGAKVKDKLPLVEEFIVAADHVIVAGAMANSFLHYNGHPTGASVREGDADKEIKHIYSLAKEKTKLYLPEDVAVGKTTESSAERRDVVLEEVQADDMILDIGPHTMAKIAHLIEASGTVIWNGTLGYAEVDQFAYGSTRVARQIAKHKNLTSVIGGGDTAEFVLHSRDVNNKDFSHISTGGGASLSLMAGEKLPGLEALLDA